MELSNRLKTVAGAVTPGHVVADIGTDHGYIPIYLLKEGICPGAIAMDINPGPLDRARVHIKKEGLEKKIPVRLSNGLEKLKTGEADTIVIAGMGGDLICRILNAAPQFLQAGKEFILQPQSEWFKVRHCIKDHHYEIEREWFLKEEGKYYVIIRALPAFAEGRQRTGRPGCIGPDGRQSGLPDCSCPEEEVYFRYGRYLLERRNPVLLEYLKKEYQKKKGILSNLDRQGLNNIPGRRKLKKEMEDIGMILERHYPFDSEPDDKPGYVVNDHLSEPDVAGRL